MNQWTAHRPYYCSHTTPSSVKLVAFEFDLFGETASFFLSLSDLMFLQKSSRQHYFLWAKESVSIWVKIHSSIIACRIPGTEEPGGLPSIGSHRVGHDWSDLAAQQINNVVIVSGAQQGDLARDIHVSILLYHPGYHITLSRDPCAI